MDPQKGMGYWLLESMGYGHKIPANQPGSHENVWVTGEYGLSGVWIIGELTVDLFYSLLSCATVIPLRSGDQI